MEGSWAIGALCFGAVADDSSLHCVLNDNLSDDLILGHLWSTVSAAKRVLSLSSRNQGPQKAIPAFKSMWEVSKWVEDLFIFQRL